MNEKSQLTFITEFDGKDPPSVFAMVLLLEPPWMLKCNDNWIHGFGSLKTSEGNQSCTLFTSRGCHTEATHIHLWPLRAPEYLFRAKKQNFQLLTETSSDIYRPQRGIPRPGKLMRKCAVGLRTFLEATRAQRPSPSVGPIEVKSMGTESAENDSQYLLNQYSNMTLIFTFLYKATFESCFLFNSSAG